MPNVVLFYLNSMLEDYNVILASKSPRRRQLLDGLNIPFEVVIHEVDEVFPEGLSLEEIPVYLAKLKAEPFTEEISHDALIITADTIVWVDDMVLGKPLDYEHAAAMLRQLSGKKHIVATGVCLTTKLKQVSFCDTTEVYFKELTDSEIKYYLDNYRPYDKAGSYGVQEWIGYIAITKIEGSYFNVMGLPVQRLYEELQNF